MSESTTVRVQKRTRELLREASAAAGDVTVDTLIQDALKALQWQRLKAQARADAARIAADPGEQFLAEAISRDFAAMAEAAPYDIPPHDPRYFRMQERRRLQAEAEEEGMPVFVVASSPRREPSDKPARRPRKAAKKAAQKAEPEPGSAVREWAEQQGMTTSPRGRVSQESELFQ